jgi:hypothetical protein
LAGTPQLVHTLKSLSSLELVVEAGVERVVVPLVRRLPLGMRQCLLRLQRVVDDDDIGATPGQHAADRGGEPAALCGRVEFGHRGALRRQARRENPPIPVAGDDVPAVARQFIGEVLGIADAEDLRRGIMPETPGREGDRGQQRLQVARRQVDDQPPDLAATQCCQLRGDDFDMPAHREAGSRVQLAEAALREADEIAPQQGAVLVQRRHQRSGDHAPAW